MLVVTRLSSVGTEGGHCQVLVVTRLSSVGTEGGHNQGRVLVVTMLSSVVLLRPKLR